jgi:hypothetical protein
VNPLTGTNWEGTGVAPDVQVPADKALEAAHLEALRKLRALAKDEREKQRRAWQIQKLEALARPVTLSAEVLKSFAGRYGRGTLLFENGALWYQWRVDGPKLRAVPMSADTLMLDEVDHVRFRIEKDASGKVTGLTELTEDGGSEKSPRSGS